MNDLILTQMRAVAKEVNNSKDNSVLINEKVKAVNDFVEGVKKKEKERYELFKHFLVEYKFDFKDKTEILVIGEEYPITPIFHFENIHTGEKYAIIKMTTGHGAEKQDKWVQTKETAMPEIHRRMCLIAAEAHRILIDRYQGL